MQEEKSLWNCTIEDIVRGYEESEEGYRCVFCGRQYTRGRIYEQAGALFSAYGAVREHIRGAHGCAADYLLGQSQALTGLSEVQSRFLSLAAEGKGDKEIAEEMGIAQSTVRNHRFKLREKEKQATLFLALMRSLERKAEVDIMKTDMGEIQELHPTAAMVDDRYVITGQEREKTIRTYMNEDGSLKQIPAREKKKIIVLREIMKSFRREKEYTEKEVNAILKRIYEADFPSIRRALIEYGFMERSDDCSIYRVKE